jgi:hypothetical protein
MTLVLRFNGDVAWHTMLNTCVRGALSVPRHHIVFVVACGSTLLYHACSGRRVHATILFIFFYRWINFLGQLGARNTKIFEQCLQKGNFIQIFIFLHRSEQNFKLN